MNPGRARTVRHRRRIFPDEEGTERGRPRSWPSTSWSRRIFPDEEGTERRVEPAEDDRERRRRIFPDEEGTERFRIDGILVRSIQVAESSPMRRGLKEGEVRRLHLGRVRRRIFPDEEGTESLEERVGEVPQVLSQNLPR